MQLGQKADYYKQNQSEFSHKSLLRDFGVNEKLADEMLVDKGILFKQRTYEHLSFTKELYSVLRSFTTICVFTLET